MPYEFSFLVDPGRVRHNNEDAIVADPARGLAVLADGMGGYNAGEVASAMATSLLARQLGEHLDALGPAPTPGDAVQALRAAADHANRSIFQAARDHASYRGMGTTLVAAVFRAQCLVLGHIGDSRAYRWRRGALTRLTRDHSLLQEQLDAGLITPQQAAVSLHRNLVTRALGIEETVRFEVHEHVVEPGDCYLLCSDGLTDMVDDTRISAILARPGRLQDKVHALVDAANAQGGRDNIAVLLAQAPANAPPRGWFGRIRRRWHGRGRRSP